MLRYLDESTVSLGILKRGVYEPAETLLVKRLIQSGWHVLNIGAHIGYYTVMFSKLVGPKGHVIALEPDKRNAELLRKNVQGFENILVLQLAASDVSKKIKFYRHPSNSGGNRLMIIPGVIPEVVEAIRIDDLDLDKTVPIDFVKIDAEGAEMRILRGMQKTLRRVKHLMMEFSPLHFLEFGEDPLQLPVFLPGFSIHDIRQGCISIPITELTKRYSKSGQLTNLYCRKIK